MDQNSALYFLSAVVQAAATVMAIMGTFMVFAYCLKSVQIIAITDFVILFLYIILVQLLMRPKVLAVDLRITGLQCEQTEAGLRGRFFLQNPGTDMARDVKLFLRLAKDSVPVTTDLWNVSLVAKGSPYIQEGGIRQYKLENEYEFFGGDLHAGDSNPCEFDVVSN